jgi:hypothetical protein
MTPNRLEAVTAAMIMALPAPLSVGDIAASPGWDLGQQLAEGPPYGGRFKPGWNGQVGPRRTVAWYYCSSTS